MKARMLFLLICILLFALSGCSEEDALVPPRSPEALADANALSYSGVVVIGSSTFPWTGESGMLVFSVVRNHSDIEWEGYPEAAVYSINSDNTRGELIGIGQGVLTTHVQREDLTPSNELKRVPAHEEREALTFVPVDFNVHPRVYVYWRFVDTGDKMQAFQNEIINPGTQRHFSLTEARAFLKSSR